MAAAGLTPYPIRIEVVEYDIGGRHIQWIQRVAGLNPDRVSKRARVRRRSVRGPRRGRRNPAISESRQLGYLISRLNRAVAYLGSGMYQRAAAENARVGIVDAIRLAEQLQGQARRGVHRNPYLGIVGNPPRTNAPEVAGTLAERVYEVRYRHAADHKDYKHSFGSGVRLTLLKDGRAILWHPVKPIWKDFPQ